MSPWTVIAIIVLSVILIGFLYVEWMAQFRPPKKAPRTFLRRGRKADTETLVVCAGDSLTHATISGDYVEMLRRRFAGEGVEFINAGITANLTFNLLERMDDIIACKPDVVTVLIGTNDVNATLRERSLNFYRRRMGIKREPTIDDYRENLTKIIERFQNETDARIAVMSLPMLGENLEDPANKRIEVYSAVAETVSNDRGVTYLPLWEKITGALKAFPADSRPYEGKKNAFYIAAMLRYLLFLSWDKIGDLYHFRLMTDYIHLNNRGAALVADLVESFVREDHKR